MDSIYEKALSLIDKINKKGETVFHYCKTIEEAKWILSKKPELLNIISSEGQNILHKAALSSRIEMIKWLTSNYP